MNIQDLQSIKSLNIPVVICVINNNGYLAIKTYTKRIFKWEFLWNTSKMVFGDALHQKNC